MNVRRFLVALAPVVAASALFGAGIALADWPDHPIRWVVPLDPGGANDLIARAAAEAVLALQADLSPSPAVASG
jgi:tripartite-type tricarboxylate transporter receptor subunit TctC